MRKFGYLLSTITLCGSCLFGCDLSADDVSKIIDNIDNIKIVINDDEEKPKDDKEITEEENMQDDTINNEDDDEENDYIIEENEENFEEEEEENFVDDYDQYEEQEGYEEEFIDEDNNNEENNSYDEYQNENNQLVYDISQRGLYGNYQLYPIGNTVSWNNTSGTLTFYDPLTGKWGAMGHKSSADVVGNEIRDALVREVGIVEDAWDESNTDKYQAITYYEDGELIYGVTTQNGEKGVYGDYDANQGGYVSQIYEVGWKDEVHIGTAQIISEVPNMESDGLFIYTIEITAVYEDYFNFKIVDEHMLADGYGVVAGMSGTPVIQDNRIIGAIAGLYFTDSDIENNGYATYIEDMLIESGIIK